MLTQSDLRRIGQRLGVRFEGAPHELAMGANLLEHTDWAELFDTSLSHLIVLPRLFDGTCEPDDDRALAVFWFPSGLPKRFSSLRSVFVASSRLGQLMDRTDWFDALRTLACRLDGNGVYLLTGDGTAADRFVHRVGSLFDIPVVSVCGGPKVVDRDWFLKSVGRSGSRGNGVKVGCHSGYVFHVGRGVDRKALDPTLIQVASEVRALSVRKNGIVDKAISERCTRLSNHNVFLLDSKSETKPDVLQRLFDAGCHQWILLGSKRDFGGDGDGGEGGSGDGGVERGSSEVEFRVPVVQELPPGEFLIHCTRARVGAWPDQDEADYLDQLIFQDEYRDRSVHAALNRIQATGRIRATNQLTRDNRKVVCFTSATLEELKSLTKFRSHLSRWDFQPVGIAIRLSALKMKGARPVIYGDEATWESLPAEDRPFFQVAKTITRTGNVLDWTQEKEWRVVGDVELRDFGVDEIFAISAM